MTPLEVSMLLLILAFCAVLAIAIALFGERIRNAILRGNQQMRQAALADLELQRERLQWQVEVRREEIIPRLNQIAFDVTGTNPGIDQLIDVKDQPAPTMVALGGGFEKFLFTTSREALLKAREVGRRARHHTIDAVSSGLFVGQELDQIYRKMAGEDGLKPVVLPRTSSWELVILPHSGKRKKPV